MSGAIDEEDGTRSLAPNLRREDREEEKGTNDGNGKLHLRERDLVVPLQLRASLFRSRQNIKCSEKKTKDNYSN